MPAYKLKENHPLHRKVEALFQYLEDNKLSIFVARHELYIEDETKQYPTVKLTDNESSEGMTEMPANLEWKLTYRKDDDAN
jgi:hypothetical protein